MRRQLIRMGILVLAFSVTVTPEMLMAQQSTPPQDQPLQNQSNLPQQLSKQPAQPQTQTPDEEQQGEEQQSAPEQQQAEPAQQLPNAPSAEAQQQNGSSSSQTQPTTPLGTAAAEKGVTYGGAASRPAGAAIAPAKQKQSRSLIIKIGAIAAGLAALGTIYALTRTSPSTPPNSGAALNTPQP